MAKLGSIKIFNETESANYSVDATTYDVEKGEPLTDHVKRNPSEFSVSGYVFEDWETIQEKMKSSMDKGKLLKYVGKISVTNVIILSIKQNHDADIANGTSITVTLRKVRISKTPYNKAKDKSKIPNRKETTTSGKKKPTGKRPNEKVYHTTRAGDTYWGLSLKYGSSVPQLRSWNKYGDRVIPIGVKLRVS